MLPVESALGDGLRGDNVPGDVLLDCLDETQLDLVRMKLFKTCEPWRQQPEELLQLTRRMSVLLLLSPILSIGWRDWLEMLDVPRCAWR